MAVSSAFTLDGPPALFPPLRPKVLRSSSRGLLFRSSLVEDGAVAGAGGGAFAGDEADVAGAGHDEEVEQVAAAGSAEVGVTGSP